MRTFSEVVKDTGKGAVRGGLWGAVAGAACILAAPLTGGASLTGLVALLPAAGGAAVLGAKVGGIVGGVMGAAGETEKIDKIASYTIVGLVGSQALSDGARNVEA